MSECAAVRSGFAVVRNLIIGLALIGGLVQTAFSSAPAAAGIFNPESFTLANGLDVVVIRNDRAPVAIQMLWYRVGAMDEPPGRSGLAHMLEHLMFKGTKTVSAGEFSRLVARGGGSDNAFTSRDYTTYVQRVAADQLEMVMRLESDRMRNLTFDAEAFRLERDVVLEERRARIDNNPAALLREHVAAALFLNHPYRLPTIGWAHELRALTRADALVFYRRFYAPNNAVLVIAGDVTAAEVKRLATKYYGPIAPSKVNGATGRFEPPHRAARRVVHKSPRVGQPSWSRSYLAPSHNVGDRVHVYPLVVLSELLGSGATSRFYRELVVTARLAAGIGVSYDSSGRGPGTFSVIATPRPGVDIAKLEAAIEDEIRRLLADGVTEEEVARAKQRLQDQAIYARDSLGTGANLIGRALASGRAIDDVERWPERIGAVTAAEVAAAVRAVLREDHGVTALLLPAVKG